MRYKLKTAPSEYPVSLAEVKAHLRLDSVSFADDLTTSQTIVPGSHSVTTHTGSSIDVLGYSAIINLDAGDCSSGSVAVTVQESADASDWETFDTFTTVNNANDNAVQEMEYTGTQRYIRAVAVVSTAACEFGVSVITDKYTDNEDSLLTNLIIVATDVTETFLSRRLISQTWELWMDEWPTNDYMKIGYPPLTDVNSITYYDTDGDDTAFTDFFEDTDSEPGRICLNYGYSWPSTTLRTINGICIDFDCGYADADSVPQVIKQGILILIAHMYEHREIVNMTGAVPQEIPFTYRNLLSTYKVEL